MPNISMEAHQLSFTEQIFLLKKKVRNFLPKPLVSVYFSFYPILGHFIFSRPSKKIKLVGITGTDGKSSTVVFTVKLLRDAGYKVGYFSSVFYSEGDGDKVNGFKMTMPGRFFLQRFLKKLVDNSCDIAVIEVTSEGIKQKRNLCMDFDVVLITNINPEHIESHGGFENYKNTKANLFTNLMKGSQKGIAKTIIVNNDDETAKTFSSFPSERSITFGRATTSKLQVSHISADFFRSQFSIVYDNQTYDISLPAGGPFVVDNILASLAITCAFDIPLKNSISALKDIKNPPGRFEVVSSDPMIIVDYAHTIAGVEKLLSFVRKNWSKDIVHVFGAAGGGRDTWKRPELAKLSEKYTTVSILTEENPFDEPTIEIIDGIRKGFSEKRKIYIEEKRPKAVKKGFDMILENEGLLLLTAKGSETVIAGPCGKKFPYNERETVLCLLNK
jgi:UDP-N-acetylmuramoyl-L-alanyl-D-glutamate--2,6-diaminopimelate ligase